MSDPLPPVEALNAWLEANLRPQEPLFAGLPTEAVVLAAMIFAGRPREDQRALRVQLGAAPREW